MFWVLPWVRCELVIEALPFGKQPGGVQLRHSRSCAEQGLRAGPVGVGLDNSPASRPVTAEQVGSLQYCSVLAVLQHIPAPCQGNLPGLPLTAAFSRLPGNCPAPAGSGWGAARLLLGLRQWQGSEEL